MGIRAFERLTWKQIPADPEVGRMYAPRVYTLRVNSARWLSEQRPGVVSGPLAMAQLGARGCPGKIWGRMNYWGID